MSETVSAPPDTLDGAGETLGEQAASSDHTVTVNAQPLTLMEARRLRRDSLPRQRRSPSSGTRTSCRSTRSATTTAVRISSLN